MTLIIYMNILELGLVEKKVQAFCQKVNEKKASAFGEISQVPNIKYIKLFSGPNHPPITIQFHEFPNL